jgi:hypothetical protein
MHAVLRSKGLQLLQRHLFIATERAGVGKASR